MHRSHGRRISTPRCCTGHMARRISTPEVCTGHMARRISTPEVCTGHMARRINTPEVCTGHMGPRINTPTFSCVHGLGVLIRRRCTGHMTRVLIRERCTDARKAPIHSRKWRDAGSVSKFNNIFLATRPPP